MSLLFGACMIANPAYDPGRDSSAVDNRMADPALDASAPSSLDALPLNDVQAEGQMQADALLLADTGFAAPGAAAAHSFTDGFDDGVPGPTWQRVIVGGCSIAERNGEVRFTLNGTGAALCAYQSTEVYDLRNSYVQLSVPIITHYFLPLRSFLQVQDTSGNLAQIGFAGSAQLFFEATGLASEKAAYGGTQDLWWRLRGSDTQLFWESSGNGTIWQTRRTAKAPLSLDAVRVTIGAAATDVMKEPVAIGHPSFNITP